MRFDCTRKDLYFFMFSRFLLAFPLSPFCFIFILFQYALVEKHVSMDYLSRRWWIKHSTHCNFPDERVIEHFSTTELSECVRPIFHFSYLGGGARCLLKAWNIGINNDGVADSNIHIQFRCPYQVISTFVTGNICDEYRSLSSLYDTTFSFPRDMSIS